MLRDDELHFLTKDTDNFPESSFYLGFSDILARKTKKELPNQPRREARCRMIEEVDQRRQTALALFSNDKDEYTPIQKMGFMRRKHCVDEELKALQIMHIKMLIKELTII